MPAPTDLEPPSPLDSIGLFAEIATAAGRHPLSPLARRTCIAYASTVFGVSLRPQDIPPRRQHMPAPEVVTRHLHHLALAVVVDAPLDPARVEAFAGILEASGRTHPVVEDLRAIGRGGNLGPRLRITQRILRDRFSTTMLGALGQTLALRIRPDRRGSARYDVLTDAPRDSFAEALRGYYEDNRFPRPGMRNGFPISLVAVHDVAHVLGGFDTTHTGELLVSAFETGVSGRGWVDYWVGGMLHCQLGFAMEPGATPARGQFPPERFYAAYARGVGARPSIIDPHWDFWPLLHEPLDDVRATLGLRGHPDVKPGQTWCGPGGPPYQRDVPAPLPA